MSNEALNLLVAYGVGFLSAIVCIIPPFYCNRGYQPRRPSKYDKEKAKPPQKSGVPRLCKNEH